jgi:hypothetical protein
MGGSPKVSVPAVDPQAARDAAYVPPAMQQSPTAAAGDTAKQNAAMAAGLGFGGTVLTSGAGLTQMASTTRKGLLGV